MQSLKIAIGRLNIYDPGRSTWKDLTKAEPLNQFLHTQESGLRHFS